MSANIYTDVKNRTASPVFKGIDVSDTMTLVGAFSETDGLPIGFFKGRVLIENMATVRTYSADGLTYTEADYVDASYVDDEFGLALSPTPGGVFQWTQEATHGYGDSNNEITYYGITQAGEIPIPSGAGDCFGIHRAINTNHVWVGFTTAFFEYHNIDVTDMDSILINMHNQRLCCGMSGQKIEGGSEVWNRQAIVVSNGDQNKAEPQYKNMEGVPVDDIADARHGHYSVGGGKMLGDGIARRGYISLLDAGDASQGNAPMDENLGVSGEPDGAADDVEFIADSMSGNWWVLMTVGGGTFPQLKVMRIFGYAMDTPGSDEYLSTFDDSAEALGSKINRNTTNVAELDNRVGDLEDDVAANTASSYDNSVAIDTITIRLDDTLYVDTTDGQYPDYWFIDCNSVPLTNVRNIWLVPDFNTGSFSDIGRSSTCKIRLWDSSIGNYIGNDSWSRWEILQGGFQEAIFSVSLTEGIDCHNLEISGTNSMHIAAEEMRFRGHCNNVEEFPEVDFYYTN